MMKKRLIITMMAAAMALSACGNKKPETMDASPQQETTTVEETKTEPETETETETETQAQPVDWKNAQVKLLNCASYFGEATKKDYTSICFAVEMPDAETDGWMAAVQDITVTDSSAAGSAAIDTYTAFKGIGVLCEKNAEGKIEPGTFTITFPDGNSVSPSEYADDATAAKYNVYRLDDGVYWLRDRMYSGVGSGHDADGQFSTLDVIMDFSNIGPGTNGAFDPPSMKNKLKMFMSDGTPMMEALGADKVTFGTEGDTEMDFRFNGTNEPDFQELWDDYITKPGTYLEYTRADGTVITIPLVSP